MSKDDRSYCILSGSPEENLVVSNCPKGSTADCSTGSSDSLSKDDDGCTILGSPGTLEENLVVSDHPEGSTADGGTPGCSDSTGSSQDDDGCCTILDMSD